MILQERKKKKKISLRCPLTHFMVGCVVVGWLHGRISKDMFFMAPVLIVGGFFDHNSRRRNAPPVPQTIKITRSSTSGKSHSHANDLHNYVLGAGGTK